MIMIRIEIYVGAVGMGVHLEILYEMKRRGEGIGAVYSFNAPSNHLYVPS